MHPDKEISHATLSVPSRSSRLRPVLAIVGSFAGVAVIVAVVVWANGNGVSVSNSTPADSQGPAGTVVVSPNGFSPQTIKIKAGQTVNWVNNDPKPHQPSTDPYPLENALAGFIAPAPLQLGESYSYTFEKAGTYTYHDHLNPLALRGTIIAQ